MAYSILVVEDQFEIREIIAKYLVREGFKCFEARDGFEALDIFESHNIHLIILDIMMPGIDGFEVLERIRRNSDVPVIMLTAKQDESDKLEGFDTGADDYVTKPFSVNELIRRVKALLKRIYNDSEEIVYRYKNLSLNPRNMKLFRGECEIEITAAEFYLLKVMFQNVGTVLTREQLIELAFGNEYEGYDRNIDSYIKRIRQKIEIDPGNPSLLLTKYGAGYVFGVKV